MAVDSVTTPVVDGLYLHGEFLGAKDQRPRKWTDRDGGEHTEEAVDVRVLVGSSLVVIQYPDAASARAALAGAQQRDRVALLVYNRHGVKDGRAWQFYAGPRSDA